MSSVEPPARLVVLAPNWLGDAVMALPLLADLRRAWPDTHLTIAARGAVAALFAMVPSVSHVITFEGGGGRPAVSAWRENVRLLHAGNFDAALLLPNSFLSAWLAARARIPERWGFARDLRGPLLTRAIRRPSATVHQADYYQALAKGLALSSGDRLARIAVADDATARARALLDDAGVGDGQRFVVFAPGAAYGRAKQWLPERFAQLSALCARDGMTTVLVGAKNDSAACQRIAALSPNAKRVIDLSGRTDLATLAGVLSLSEAVISNDSGAMHLAAAAGARVVAVFGPTDDRKTSPLRAAADAPEPKIVKTDVWCRPCMLRECPIDHRCMTRISATEVFNVVEGVRSLPSPPSVPSAPSTTARSE
jgi:heptosyltransferase II